MHILINLAYVRTCTHSYIHTRMEKDMVILASPPEPYLPGLQRHTKAVHWHFLFHVNASGVMWAHGGQLLICTVIGTCLFATTDRYTQAMAIK